jgi:hypothetical protein
MIHSQEEQDISARNPVSSFLTASDIHGLIVISSPLVVADGAHEAEA